MAVVDLPDAAAQCAALRALGADEVTFAEVMRLLAHDDQPTQFSAPVAAAAVNWLDHEIRPGDRLGAWSLDSELGHGDVAQPLAEADALRRQALVLSNNGQTEAAEAPARRTRALRGRHDPKNLQDIADAENRLGILLMNLRRYDEAATQLEHAYTLREQGLGVDDPNTSSTLHNLARLNHLRGELVTA